MKMSRRNCLECRRLILPGDNQGSVSKVLHIVEQHLFALLEPDLDFVGWNSDLDGSEPELGMIDDVPGRKDVVHIIGLYGPFRIDAKRICFLGTSGAGSLLGGCRCVGGAICNGNWLNFVVVGAAAHRARDPANDFAIHSGDNVGSLVLALTAIRT